jgi:MoxR-like ATPase
LPEAQLDRFMMEIRVGYPTKEQERNIVLRTAAEPTSLPASAFTKEDFSALRKIVRAVPVPDVVVDHAVDICTKSRPETTHAVDVVNDYVAFGAGPRGSQNLVLAAKARALMMGRPAPIVADVREVALPILRHRILMNHRAIGDGYRVESLIETFLK